MKIAYSFFVLFSCCNVSFSQSIIQAVGNQWGNTQFEYDPATISESKIEYIEKVEYDFSYAPLDTGFVSERHQFRHDGRPIRIVYANPYEGETKWIDFEYDVRHNLIRKTTTSKFFGTYGRTSMEEADEWLWHYSYDTLTKVLHYKRGIYRDWSLYDCDSIEYDQSDTCVTVYSGFSEHVENWKEIKGHSESFNKPRKFVLTFHENGMKKNEIHLKDSLIQVFNETDECGNSMNSYRVKINDTFKNAIGYSGCLPKDLWFQTIQFERDIDLGNDTVQFKIGQSIICQREIPHSPCGGNFLRVNKIDSIIEVQSECEQFIITQSVNETRYSRNKRFYDFNFKLLRTESYSSGQCDASVHNLEIYDYFNNDLLKSITKSVGKETYFVENYSYFENGLVKSIESRYGNKPGTKVEYRCSVFEVKKAPAARF